MRILFITKSTGGIAQYVRSLIAGLDRRIFSITAACLSENSIEFAEELRKIPGVQSHSYEMNRYKIDPFSDARLGWRLAKLIRSGKFDLIHAHGSKPGFLARVSALGTNLPVLYSPHCFAFHPGAGKMMRFLAVALERLMARYTAKYVAVSDGERQMALQYRVGVASQFAVIHTGIDAGAYREPVGTAELKASLGIPASSPVIGSVGRLSPQKSPLDFVRVAAEIQGTRPDVHFIWVGGGPLEKDVRALSDFLHVNANVHWLGQRSDIPRLLHMFDYFLLPSKWEGFPLVLLEAMAAGVPVIATDIPGTREAILHGSNGWLAPAGDPQMLARLLLDLLANPAISDAFRVASRTRIAQEFTQSRMLDAIQKLYLKMALPTAEAYSDR